MAKIGRRDLIWRRLGACWGHFGLSGGHISTFRGYLGASRDPLGSMLWPRWAFWGPSWNLLGPVWLAHLHAASPSPPGPCLAPLSHYSTYERLNLRLSKRKRSAISDAQALKRTNRTFHWQEGRDTLPEYFWITCCALSALTRKRKPMDRCTSHFLIHSGFSPPSHSRPCPLVHLR